MKRLVIALFAAIAASSIWAATETTGGFAWMVPASVSSHRLTVMDAVQSNGATLLSMS